MILSLERRLALTPSVASLQTLTLRSSVRFRGVAPHHRSPTSAMEPAGQDLGAPLAPEINGQYRSNGARMPVLSGQCCRSRSATFDRRIAAVESLARDRFDSDCVLGTQFESSQPHHAFSCNGDFPDRAISPELAGFLCGSVSAVVSLAFGLFRNLCLCRRNSVSRKQRFWFEETRFDCVIIEQEVRGIDAGGAILPAGRRGGGRPCRGEADPRWPP